MIRRTLMNRTRLDELLMCSSVQCIYMHIAESEDYWGSNAHDHGYNEICYVAHGSGTYIINGMEYSMNKDDLFFLPKGTVHSERCNTDEPYELRFIMLENVGERGAELDEMFFSKPNRYRGVKVSQIKKIFDRIMDEIIEYDEGYLSTVEVCLKMLYTTVYREFLAGQEKRMNVQASDSKLRRRDFLSERIRTYVLENVGNVMTVEKLAEDFHYHPKYLTQLIKQETGKTLSEFIMSIRLECVCRLLTQSQHSISDVQSMCGFGNAAHFFRAFKRSMGVTPTQYRRRHQNAPRDRDVKL